MRMPKGKHKKSMQSEVFGEDGDSQASSVMEEEDKQIGHDREHMDKVNFSIILKEPRDYRKDNSQQLKGIREEINKTNSRIEEAELRIVKVETLIQIAEGAVTELLKLQIHFVR